MDPFLNRADTPERDPERRAADLEPAATARRAQRFLLFDAFELHKTASTVTCMVRLRHRHNDCHGEATELDTESGRIRAAARAALAAASQAAPNVQFGLEAATVVPLTARRCVVIVVEAVRQRRFTHLTGIAALEPARSTEEAAVLATLDAIERWIAA